MKRLKIVAFTVKANSYQHQEWGIEAKRRGFANVGRWLEQVADTEIARRRIGETAQPPLAK